jgi:ABC-type multidrug transport system fused ATPase/permease subunit
MVRQVKKLYKLMTPVQKRKLALLQVLVIFMAFSEILSVLSIGPFMAIVGDMQRLNGEGVLAVIYRYSGAESPTQFLTWMGGGVLVILLFSTLVSTFTMWKLSKYGAKVGAELSDALFSHYMNKPWVFHIDNASSHLTNKISHECLRITNMVIRPALQMNAKIVLVSFMLTGIFMYNPIVALIGGVVFILSYFLLFISVRQRLSVNGNLISESQSFRFKLMNEGFGGIKDILLLSRQENLTQRFETESDRFAQAQGGNQALSQVPRYVMELVAFGSIISLILYLLSEHKGELGDVLPVLSVYALAGFKLLPALQQIYMSASQIKGNISAFESIEHDLAEKRFTSPRNNVADSKPPIRIDPENEICLKNVRFRYPGKPRLILNELNLALPCKKVIGLVGSSGSGKSTAIDVLLGLLTPEQGVLTVDGVKIDQANIRGWQQAIGFVPQSIFLADSTIRENIAFGLPPIDIDDKKVKESIKMAHLEELVESLEFGLDTKVGERGVQLSGGQRQRIGIARALYHDASVLVLDEATSALDGITEKLIMEAIHDLSGKKTIVMIAHRLATVKECDLIYVLKDGRVVDEGTFEFLSANNKLFQKMLEHS